MPTYGYVRVSTDRQANDGESLAVQQQLIEAWAKAHDTVIDRLFIEAGVSGTVPFAERPQGALLLGLLKRGDTIVGTKLDRMFRDVHDASGMVKRCKRDGIKLYPLDISGEVTSGTGKFTFHIMVAVAEQERDRIAERIRTSKAHQKSQGRYLGGKVPFGYRVDAARALVLHPREQAVIADLRAFAATMSIRKACRKVVEQHGVRLSHQTATKLLAG